MKSNIRIAFEKCKNEKRPALLTYTVAGDNTKKKSLEILNAIAPFVDIIEVGIPHNTPVADGGQIQSSAYRAIKNGIKIKDIFQIVKQFKKNKNIIITGDFNVIPSEEDVGNPEDWTNDALFKLEIRKKFRSLLNLGFKDGFRLFNKEPKEYTFWDYQQGSWQRNKGLRIDHYLVSDSMIQDLKTIEIDKFTRDNERPSDHVPIRCVLT